MKRSLATIFASCFLLSACQFSVSWGEIEEDDAVAEENPVEQAQQNQSNELEMPELQVTPYDQELGITIENNEFYQLIANMIENNPSIGTANDFYMTTVHVLENEDNEFSILFVAVNRIGDAIKNIDFKLDIRTTDGEIIFDNIPINLPEQVAGVIQHNGAIPVFVPATAEQIESFKEASAENTTMELLDFSFDIEDESL